MRYSAIVACFIFVFLALSKADFTSTTNTTIAGANVSINVYCSANSSIALAAAWLGNNQKSINSSTISQYVNSTVPFNTINSVLYAFQSTTALNVSTFTFQQISNTSLRNSGENYTYVVYCTNASNPSIISTATYNKWNQQNNNGTDFFFDVTYNASINGTALTTLQTNQTQAILSFFSKVLLPSQVVNGSAAVTPSNTTIRTYILRNYNTNNDNTYLINNATLTTDVTTALNNALNLSTANVTLVNFGSIASPAVNITVVNTTNSSTTLNVLSSVNGISSLVGALATYDEEFLSNDNVFAITTENGGNFTIIVQQQQAIVAGQVYTLVVPSLNSNTAYKFFGVVQSFIPSNTLSNITEVQATTGITPINPNSTYTASVSTSVVNNTVTITLNCSLPSVVGAYDASIGNHLLNVTNAFVENCAGTGSFVVINNNTALCGKQTATAATTFTFTITPNNLQNVGRNYNFQAICKNSSGSYATVSGSWNSPDNGGRNFRLDVNYSGTFNTSSFQVNQSNAFAYLLPNVSSNLIQTTQGISSNYARSLQNTTSATISTYIYRNYSLANDSTLTYVTALFANQTLLVSQLQSFYTTNNFTNLTVVGATATSLYIPVLTLGLVSETSNSVTLNLGSNVDGTYTLVAVANSTYNNSADLDASDVLLAHDENGNSFTINQNGALANGVAVNVTVSSLKANTTYNFYAVVQDKLPTPSVSLIANQSATTSAGGNFAGKLFGFGLVLMLVIFAFISNLI
jgi:hypothetical protein